MSDWEMAFGETATVRLGNDGAFEKNDSGIPLSLLQYPVVISTTYSIKGTLSIDHI